MTVYEMFTDPLIVQMLTDPWFWGFVGFFTASILALVVLAAIELG